MIYILEQRLAAQNIVREKAVRVLQDVSNAMFSEELMNQVHKPQLMLSVRAVRSLFERIAHSSIMKLSESSMEKLFELMLMGFKFQLVRCTHPRQIIDITVNHLESVISMIQGTSTVPLLNQTLSRVLALSSEMSTGEMSAVRQTILNLFQDKRIKVSLFLQDNVQHHDGTLVMLRGGFLQTPYDPTVELPGTVRYFNADSVTVREQDTVAHPDRDMVCVVPANSDKFPRVTLGFNLYTVPKKPGDGEAPEGMSTSSAQRPAGAKNVGPARPPLPPIRITTSTGSEAAAVAPPSAAPRTVEAVSATPPTVVAQSPVKPNGGNVVSSLQNLAAFIGTGPVSKGPSLANMNLNLFGEDRAGRGGGDTGASNEIHITQMTREELEKYNSELVDVMNDFSTGATASGAQNKKDDDLLDLLDST